MVAAVTRERPLRVGGGRLQTAQVARFRPVHYLTCKRVRLQAPATTVSIKGLHRNVSAFCFFPQNILRARLVGRCATNAFTRVKRSSMPCCASRAKGSNRPRGGPSPILAIMSAVIAPLTRTSLSFRLAHRRQHRQLVRRVDPSRIVAVSNARPDASDAPAGAISSVWPLGHVRTPSFRTLKVDSRTEEPHRRETSPHALGKVPRPPTRKDKHAGQACLSSP